MRIEGGESKDEQDVKRTKTRPRPQNVMMIVEGLIWPRDEVNG